MSLVRARLNRSPTSFLLSLSAILLLTCIVFWPLLAPGAAARYPWGSDALGHVLKAQYLGPRLAGGNPYPDLLPGWYMGVQMLRSYPPLPYYLLAGLTWLAGDGVIAAGWFVALCAGLGGAGLLLFRRELGWWGALAGGALFVLLPDHLRVGLAEGNLPRALATALLPLVLFCLLRALGPAPQRRTLLLLALSLMVVTLCHAMMAAIYSACGALLALLALGLRATSARAALRAGLLLAGGVLLSGWWLIPSLRGGITALDAAAMTEALAVVPLTEHLNPLGRAASQEAPYFGAALLLCASALLFVRRGRTRLTIALTLTGLAAILISTPMVNPLWTALPFSQLLWPLRFLGIASTLLLLAVLLRLRALGPWLAALLIGVLALDGLGSLPLIRRAALHPDVAAIAARLQPAGWRVATLDLSRMGSAPTYAFAANGREQIFGWAYQGAYTAKTVAGLNAALEQGDTAYLIDRLERYGVDDVALLNSLPRGAAVAAALTANGFALTYHGQTLTLFSHSGGPRGQLDHCPALGIGRGAPNLAYLFPAVCVAGSEYLDDYSPAELARYQTLVLAGFRWHSRAAAEALTQQAASGGVRVVVDLSGVPNDPLAQAPRFLGVWGEPLTFDQRPLMLEGPGASLQLQPLGTLAEPWVAPVPQGLSSTRLSFTYAGQQAVALGEQRVGGAAVTFIGANLAYHAALTHDPAAVQVLAEALGLTPGASGPQQAVALADYHADERGYRFGYTLARAGRLFVPIAALPGARLTVDGAPAQIVEIERLVAFDAPSGTHLVTITIQPTPIYWLGLALSCCALVAVGLWLRRFRPSQINLEQTETSASGAHQ